MRPLVAIVLKLEAIDDARRHQYGGGKPRKEIVQPSLARAVPHGIAPRRGRQQGACSSTLCGRIGFKPASWPPRLTNAGGWSSSGPTEVWLHGHDLGGKAREITRAKKLYVLARYHSRTESVARMRGMKVPASIEAASRFMGPRQGRVCQYNDGDPRGLFATGGVGVSWNFVPQWSVISEVFAIMGPGQSNPRAQSGLRYSPTKDIDWDLIYGRNLTGEGANWITVALTIRIGDN